LYLVEREQGEGTPVRDEVELQLKKVYWYWPNGRKFLKNTEGRMLRCKRIGDLP